MTKVPVASGYELQCFVDDYLWPWEKRTPVLLHHGYARNASFWNCWVPYLASRYRLYRPEVRGCGGSTRPPEDYVFDGLQLAQDIVAVMDHFGLDNVHWVGESSGGIIGMIVALHFPERLASMVLVNTPAQIPKNVNQVFTLGEASPSAAVRKYGVKRWCLETISMRLDVERASSELVEWYAAQMDTTPAYVAAGLIDCFSQASLFADLHRISTPTLLLSGDKSEIAAQQQSQLKATLQNARLQLFPGYGHGINLLDPSGCARAALEFWHDIEEGTVK